MHRIRDPFRPVKFSHQAPSWHPWQELLWSVYRYEFSVKVAQSCLTLCNPMDYTVHRILQTQNTGVGSLSLLQGIFPTWGSNPGLPHLTVNSNHYWSWLTEQTTGMWWFWPLNNCFYGTEGIIYGIKDMGIHSRSSFVVSNLEEGKLSHATNIKTPRSMQFSSQELQALTQCFSVDLTHKLLVLCLWSISGLGIGCNWRLMSQVGKLWSSIVPWVWFQRLQVADHCRCLILWHGN